MLSPPGDERSAVDLPVAAPTTPLVGRAAEVADASSLLTASDPAVRLLTLVGPGGVGKTRLALAVADELRDAFSDGAVFVDLAPMREHRLVPATIARALAVHPSGGSSARDLLIEHLRPRHVLLILDNFEHLFAGDATG